MATNFDILGATSGLLNNVWNSALKPALGWGLGVDPSQGTSYPVVAPTQPTTTTPKTPTVLGTNPGAITMNTQPSAPAVKSVTTTYHPPTTGTATNYPPTSGVVTDQMKTDAQNQLNSQMSTMSSTAKTPAELAAAGAPTLPGSPYANQNTSGYNSGSTFPGLLGSLASSATTPNPVVSAAMAGLFGASQPSANYDSALAGLLNKSQGPSAEYLAATENANRYNEALKQSRINEAKGLTDNSMNPISLDSMTGRSLILQNQYGLEQSALGQAYNAATAQQGQANTQQGLEQQGLTSAGNLANTQQGLQQSGYNQAGNLAQAQQGLKQSGLTSAAGLAQPVGQFGMLTNPQTGQPLNTQIFQSAIQQAQQLVNSGTPVNDPSVQALLSPFGFVGPLAFNSAMQASQGSGWNPAVQNATAGQNISQGTVTQGQAYNLNLGLQQLKTIQPIINNFLSTAGISPTDVPAMNAQIGTYIANLKNPAAATQYQYMINDLQKFASQMLSAGAGGTPTGVQAATDLMNPQNLSMNQIKYALSTLDTLGTNQVAILQQQSAASLGGNTGYAGNPASVSTNIPAAPANPASGGINSNPFVEAGVGSAINLWNQFASIPTMIAGLIGHIFK